MNILVFGANGKTGRLIVSQLLNEKHRVTGIVRESGQKEYLESLGAEVVVDDINSDAFEHLLAPDYEAVIFAAAGDKGHYQEVDHHGLSNIVSVCEEKNIKRFISISALGAHDPDSWGGSYYDLLKAKADGENALRESTLDWTIIRPGSLHIGPAKNGVTLSEEPKDNGSLSRTDLAHLAVACLRHTHTVGKTFEAYDGDTEIDKALENL